MISLSRKRAAETLPAAVAFGAIIASPIRPSPRRFKTAGMLNFFARRGKTRGTCWRARDRVFLFVSLREFDPADEGFGDAVAAHIGRVDGEPNAADVGYFGFAEDALERL